MTNDYFLTSDLHDQTRLGVGSVRLMIKGLVQSLDSGDSRRIQLNGNSEKDISVGRLTASWNLHSHRIKTRIERLLRNTRADILGQSAQMSVKRLLMLVTP